jgi:hypothetical protein
MRRRQTADLAVEGFMLQVDKNSLLAAKRAVKRSVKP